MLQLNAEQADRLRALKLERDIATLSQALARGFPDVAGRAGERYPLLIRHGVQHAARHGLTHMLCAARYIACWFALGAEFETKPAHRWAQDILSAPSRSQGGRVFQLCRRTSETLSRLAAQGPAGGAAMPASAFDGAVAGLDAALQDRGPIGTLVPGGRVQLGVACDLDAVEFKLEASSGPLRYRRVQGQWQRLPGAAERLPVLLTASATGAAGDADGAAPPLGLPAQLFALATADGGEPARLRLRIRADACCDPAVHPRVNLVGPQGVGEWRGQATRDLKLDLRADAPPVPPGADVTPVIGAESAPRHHLVSLGSCGLRDGGRPLGELQTQIVVHPSDQHLMRWHREPGPPMSWPSAHGEPVAPPSRVHLERDGVALEATRWRLGLEDLDRRLVRGLARLATAWERESGVTDGRLEAEPSLLAGDASVTWGWAEGARGLASPPIHRIAGALELVACRLNLRLVGQLALDGSTSRLALHCAASESLVVDWDRTGADADLAALMAPAQANFRQPFVLVVDSLAADTLGVVDALAPIAGALVGSCGLRARADGLGWQWFVKLRIEPVQAVLLWHDPLLGTREMLRPLLPDMDLVDWSLG